MADSSTPLLRLTRGQLQRESSCDDDPTPSPTERLNTMLAADTSTRSLLLDDYALDLVLDESDEALRAMLLHRLCEAKTVVLARMRKDQKQAVARELRSYGRTLAQPVHVLGVGDGANDIGLIRESDIGVGIKGKEGLQAFNICDVGVPSFRCLHKLILVHGKANEMRLQTLVLFFLYKNTLLSMVTLLLSYVTMFSGLKVLPSWGVDGYNT